MRGILLTARVITAAIVIFWQLTGGDDYTKFQVVEEVEKSIEEDDPLAAAGFYDDQERTETVVKNEFRLGLLPTPNALLDKHWLSVASLLGFTWLIAFALMWRKRRQRKRSTPSVTASHL